MSNESPFEPPRAADTTDQVPPSSVLLAERTAVLMKSSVKIGLVLLFVAGFAWLLFLPAVRNVEPVRLRTQSLNNIRNIALAVHNYAAEHRGQMPPAFTVDAAGRRLHSWRVLLLPYLDEQALYDCIDLSKPWDHPDNAELAASMPRVFAAPGEEQSQLTGYMALTGPDAAFGEVPRDIGTADSRTLMLTEVPSADRVPWMKPVDNGVEFLLGMRGRSDMPHDGVVCVALQDGSCQTLSQKIDRQALEQLISVSDSKQSLEF